MAKLPDRTALPAAWPNDRLVRTMINLADVPLTDAVKMMTATPAAIMGIEKRKGSILPGKDADLVIFNDNIDIKLTMVNGRVVYRSED